MQRRGGSTSVAYQEQPVQSLSRCKVADMHTSSHRARASRRRRARLLHRSLASNCACSSKGPAFFWISPRLLAGTTAALVGDGSHSSSWRNGSVCLFGNFCKPGRARHVGQLRITSIAIVLVRAGTSSTSKRGASTALRTWAAHRRRVYCAAQRCRAFP